VLLAPSSHIISSTQSPKCSQLCIPGRGPENVRQHTGAGRGAIPGWLLPQRVRRSLPTRALPSGMPLANPEVRPPPVNYPPPNRRWLRVTAGSRIDRPCGRLDHLFEIIAWLGRLLLLDISPPRLIGYIAARRHPIPRQHVLAPSVA
jgi:hypothetical protein